ncbi:hypothetical protein H6G54_17640 [Anabaena cylindrica FACHB-243]|nr:MULTISPECIES: hypothetical protein [Anabaena]MBD2419490.1 hypothetical protein [Anabaena cylindrica FACHB-243]MBY5283983.1 hypothetical protein [Anabaena sp. CCAP 1446/1C]MBY5310809.1 hypothetical protein [Anabaena sp. CCAP 1446/1C]MCM2408327.1 hypothetical protein [Anabaena sp. CCAP 1446/1C]
MTQRTFISLYRPQPMPQARQSFSQPVISYSRNLIKSDRLPQIRKAIALW